MKIFYFWISFLHLSQIDHYVILDVHQMRDLHHHPLGDPQDSLQPLLFSVFFQTSDSVQLFQWSPGCDQDLKLHR